MTPAIELHIDHLVLPDLPGLDPAAVQAALQQALTDHVATHGIPPTWQAGPNLGALDGGSLGAPGSVTAQALGHQLAQTIYGGTTP
jgi:hypothetical protein